MRKSQRNGLAGGGGMGCWMLSYLMLHRKKPVGTVTVTQNLTN
jgi:hypothetical protein